MIRGLIAAAFSLCATAAGAVDVSQGSGAELRGLDRLTGELHDYEVPAGGSVQFGSLRISLVECRYPTANPSGDAFAYLLIDNAETGTKAFEGWMIASSPALNPLEHMRYDVWVISCMRS